MTLHQLRTFLAVVDAGSVRAAAERLVVTQPAVSSALASLATEVGVALVARDGRVCGPCPSASPSPPTPARRWACSTRR